MRFATLWVRTSDLALSATLTYEVFTHKKILAQFVRSLRADEDERQADLLFRILEQHQELVPHFWSSLPADTFSPKVTSTWILWIGFALKLSDLVVPLNPASNEPPNVTTAMGNIVPIPFRRNELSKGLQQNNELVVYVTTTFISASIAKLIRTLELCNCGNGTSDLNSWRDFGTRLVTDVMRNLPDIQVVLAGLSRTQRSQRSQGRSDAVAHEAMRRLFRDYLRVFGSIDGRLDLRKLVTPPSPGDSRHSVISYLQLLACATDSPWYSKTGAKSSLFQFLLGCCTGNPRKSYGSYGLARRLAATWLTASPLFEDRTYEPPAWIDALQLFSGDAGVQIVAFVDQLLSNCLENHVEAFEEASLYLDRNGQGARVTKSVADHGLLSLGPVVALALKRMFAMARQGEESAGGVADYLCIVLSGLAELAPCGTLETICNVLAAELGHDSPPIPERIVARIRKLVAMLRGSATLGTIEPRKDLRREAFSRSGPPPTGIEGFLILRIVRRTLNPRVFGGSARSRLVALRSLASLPKDQLMANLIHGASRSGWLQSLLVVAESQNQCFYYLLDELPPDGRDTRILLYRKKES